jgi:tetratricopeptide (TPR) repeat protein
MRRANVTTCNVALLARLAALVVVIVVGAISPVESLAQTPAAPVARAVSVQGAVEARRAGQTAWQPVKLNDTFSPGDAIRVLDRSRADISLLDQSVLRLNANTELTVEPVKDQRTGVVSLLRGATHFFSRGPRSLEVQTPFTVAGVRGTEFYIGLEPDRALLTVFEGTVLAQNPAGSLTLTSGQSGVAETGKAPVSRVVARPRDAVQWTVYYPPVLYFRPDEFPAGPDWQGMTRRSIEAYLKGDIGAAFDAIATVPATVADPRFFAYRAHLLLAVGRVDEAVADIERALRIAPDDANALALQTIIAVAQGDRDRALATAERAVRAAPKSGTAHLALSYAQQARFDLEGARASVENAVALDSNNALAWARLSELWASFAQLERAQRAAQRAVTLEPNLSRTQTVLGYAYLMRVKTKDAREAFERAIVLDQADPMPRLGLGLAKIREGKLNEGGREIETAASLDPSNALVRSYLGKTYYEEKRTGLDEREYQVAKQLDPNDPTPYFYDAIAKQTTNRPVEALHDMQRAIELNDNRAVYRSRMLLDADEAARSASLGRVYSDLGFQQLALVEGWKSVNTDSTNFSAHRLLSDTYAALPRHEIARVSELLQSQLLQPVNMTPLQPRLAESNLFLISALGPGALSFNEFNPIFNRNGATFQVTGLAGEHDTYSGEGVVAGIYRNVSFSFGGFHFSTDGWRPNATQTETIANGFVQWDVTPQTSFQLEVRNRESELGDVQQRFFLDEFDPNFTDTVESFTVRAGGRHAFTPNSILLGSFIYQDRFAKQNNDPFVVIPVINLAIDLHRKLPQEGLSFELQHLYRSRYFSLTTGAGYADVTGVLRSNLEILGANIFDFPTADTRTQHVNVYAYANINLIKNVTFTLGVSVDHMEGSSDVIPDGDKTLANPKGGITWTPLPGTTLRAAVSRVLKRTLITDQTLEPTQVAGFNQFFDDPNVTEAWRYGVALDQKITSDLFAGAELSRRDLTIPTVDLTAGTTSERSGGESLARGYLFWTPHRWLALRTEYQYEHITRSNPTTEEAPRVTTHRVPVGISFFHESGFSSSVTATYWNQHGKFQRALTTGVEDSGSDDFVTVDAAINYRLPWRYGFVTLGVTNLLDKEFKFFNTDADNPFIQPSRMVFGRVTIAVP